MAGASTAHNLTKSGVVGDTVFLEDDKITCDTTSHSVAMLNPLRSDMADDTLIQYTKTLASEVLESDTDQDTGYKKYGGLTGNPENLISVSTPAIWLPWSFWTSLECSSKWSRPWR